MRLRTHAPNDHLTSADGTETLLLYGNRVIRLGALGSAIVEHAAEPVTLENLAARLTERFGTPPGDPEATIHTGVEDLVAQGVVEWLEDLR